MGSCTNSRNSNHKIVDAYPVKEDRLEDSRIDIKIPPSIVSTVVQKEEIATNESSHCYKGKDEIL